MQKQVLRTDMKEKLSQLTDEQYHTFSKKIASQLYTHEKWKQAKTIFITVSRNKEVDTFLIIEQAWADGKRVAVPRCDVKQKTMTFREISSFTQLESGYSNIFEPIVSITKEISITDLMIVPGVAFTKKGARLGYGGGYFDKYKSNAYRIALLFSCQLVDEIPLEKHDVCVSEIITEYRGMKCDEQ